MGLVNIHSDNCDAKGFPSSQHLDLSICGFTGLKTEVNPHCKANSLFPITGSEQLGGSPGGRSLRRMGSGELCLGVHSGQNPLASALSSEELFDLLR